MSLARDRINDAASTWDWDIIKQGSRPGFRTLGVPKDWGGPGVDLVTTPGSSTAKNVLSPTAAWANYSSSAHATNYATAGGMMNTAADKLMRDGIIWKHLAGDSLSRIKTIKKLLK